MQFSGVVLQFPVVVLEFIWKFSPSFLELYLACILSVSGVYLECIWSVSGVYLEIKVVFAIRLV